MQYSFGSGVLFGKTLVNNVPTPVRFGAMQGVSIDLAFTSKQLYGQYQFPLAIGRGTGKITGKADFAQFNAQAYNDLFFGNLTGPVTGSVRTVVGEARVGAATVNATFNTGFGSDLGVIRAADGAIYTRVANAPAGLQYSVNETSGAYTFNASQANVPIALSYTYADAANGKRIDITNQLLGNSPQFSLVLTETFNAKSLTVALNSCMSTKLSFATKLEDFTIPAFDFEAFADAANSIGSISVDE